MKGEDGDESGVSAFLYEQLVCHFIRPRNFLFHENKKTMCSLSRTNTQIQLDLRNIESHFVFLLFSVEVEDFFHFCPPFTFTP